MRNPSETFLDTLMPLPVPDEVRRWDEDAASLGIPPLLLMENAGAAAFRVLLRRLPYLYGKRIWLFMGPGNNGGDAACLARYLHDAGADALVLHTHPLKRSLGASGRHVRMAKSAGVRFAPAHSSWPGELPDCIVDGLLGTGFHGELREPMKNLVLKINAAGAGRLVLSLDVPSGLNALTGRPSPVAVRADITATFAAAKRGLLMPCANKWVGELHVCPIGMPAAIRSMTPCSSYALFPRSLDALPHLPEETHKNAFGHVLILGGAFGLGGAAHLAARAALRTGAGLVSAAAPQASLEDIKSGWPEIMTCPISEGSQWPSEIAPALSERIRRASTLVIGPGMGRDASASAFLKLILNSSNRPPAVIDADALMHMAENPALLDSVSMEDVMTPHPGEAAALLQCTASDVQADRFSALQALCGLQRGVVVLKGAATLVGQTNQPPLICPCDIPQMAVGGAGDVLAGCIGGLHARNAVFGLTAFAASGMGVVLHALAGMRCAAKYPARGALASEIADAIPRVLSEAGAEATPEGWNRICLESN